MAERTTAKFEDQKRRIFSKDKIELLENEINMLYNLSCSIKIMRHQTQLCKCFLN